jgi:hypothetical protein
MDDAWGHRNVPIGASMRISIVPFVSTVLIVLFGLSGIPPSAQATCGSANCFLVTGTQDGIANPGQVIADLSYRFIPMDQVQRGSAGAADAVVPKIDFTNNQIIQAGDVDSHHEIRTNNELMQLDLTFGVTPKFALTVAIPFFNQRTHEHEHVTGGTPSNPTFGSFSREDGTAGFGDLRLIGKYALLIHTKHLLVGGLGIKAPTGEYKLRDHEGEVNEPTIQPGTGSWDGTASLYYAYEIFPHELNAFASTSYQANTENDLNYHVGNTLLVNGGVDWRASENVNVSAQINLRQAPHDAFNDETVPSTGGRWVYFTPGVRFQGAPDTALYAHVQVPIYQYVNEVNIVPRYGFIMGVSRAF